MYRAEGVNGCCAHGSFGLEKYCHGDVTQLLVEDEHTAQGVEGRSITITVLTSKIGGFKVKKGILVAIHDSIVVFAQEKGSCAILIADAKPT